MNGAAPRLPGRDHHLRSFLVPCPSCGHWDDVAVGSPAHDPPKRVRCGGCQEERKLDFNKHFGPNAVLDGCASCGYHTLYAQKDVNSRLGLVLVVVVFAALLFSGLPLPWMVGCLVVFALLDWLLLRLVVRRVLICYQCKAQYRGYPPGPSCRPFDLATWEAHAAPSSGDAKDG